MSLSISPLAAGLFETPPMAAMYGAAGIMTPTARAVSRPAATPRGTRRAAASPTRTAPAATPASSPSGRTRYVSPVASPHWRNGPTPGFRTARTPNTRAAASPSRYNASVSPSDVMWAGTGNTWNRTAAASPAGLPNRVRPSQYVGNTSKIAARQLVTWALTSIWSGSGSGTGGVGS